MNKLILAFAIFGVTAHAALLELNSAQEVNDLIKQSDVPVMIQFAAEWCGPCQELRRVLRKVAADYTDAQVKIAYVDADTNKSLGKYLKGGYPTVRTFSNGKLKTDSFVGYRSERFVRSFLDEIAGGDVRDGFCPVVL